MDEIKPKSKLDEFFENLFFVEHNDRLEKKAWFRFLRILQGLVIVIIVLITFTTAWFVFDAKTEISATLVCNDGTKWNALDKFGYELDSSRMCGACTKRSSDKSYDTCNYNDSGYYDSYQVTDRKYKQTNSPREYIFYPLIGLFISLIITKLMVKGIIYIIAGSRSE